MQTSTRTHPDLGLRDQILRSWRADHSLDASTLDAAVDVGGNQLLLSGDVGSYTDRVTAHGLAAAAVAGLLPIRNGIVVRLLVCDPTEPDAALQGRVERAVRTVRPRCTVVVDASDHVVRLSGHVGNEDERRRVHAAAARCGGVHFVDDRTTIDSTVTTPGGVSISADGADGPGPTWS